MLGLVRVFVVLHIALQILTLYFLKTEYVGANDIKRLGDTLYFDLPIHRRHAFVNVIAGQNKRGGVIHKFISHRLMVHRVKVKNDAK